MLLLAGWVFDLAAGRRAAAEAQCGEALESLIRLGLGYHQDAGGEIFFDPVEVHQFMKSEGLAGRSQLWTDRVIPTGRAHYKQLASLAESNREPRFHLRFTREFSLHHIPLGAQLRLTMPIPLESSYLRDRGITLAQIPDLPARTTLRETCIELKLAAPASRPITLAAEFALTATPLRDDPQSLSVADRALYLRPSEGLIRVTPRIEALAAALAGGTSCPQTAAAKFHDFITDHLMQGMVRYSDIPAEAPGDWVLDHGWFDCLLGAALLTCLCRARRIPARLVGGYYLYKLLPANHHWAEIWIEDAGWRPYDFRGWDLSAAGRDPQWRDLFTGCRDHRMVTEIFPLQFTGPMSVKLPPEWHMLPAHHPNGFECWYGDALDGTMTYQDRVEFLPG
jgi:hypothetical protein